MNWFDNEKRTLQWKKLSLNSGCDVVHRRLVKLYEVICIISALTLNTLISINQTNDYFYVRVVNIIGMLSSIFCIGICLIFLTIIQIVPCQDVVMVFVQEIQMFMNYPMISIIVSFISVIFWFINTRR